MPTKPEGEANGGGSSARSVVRLDPPGSAAADDSFLQSACFLEKARGAANLTGAGLPAILVRMVIEYRPWHDGLGRARAPSRLCSSARFLQPKTRRRMPAGR